jgi:hypothetical protein
MRWRTVDLPMSALPPKADMDERDEHVRFVPKADICTAAKVGAIQYLFRHGRQSGSEYCGQVPLRNSPLFDHLVGDSE